MEMKSRLATLFLLTAGLVGAFPGAAQEITADPVELTLRGMDGAEQRLSNYRGRVVILNFWATWCVPCREEMPMLMRLRKEFAARGVEVIGPSADAPETQNKIAPFLRKQKIDFPIWIGATTADMERLHLGTALPATAVLDRDGRIVGRIHGPLEEADLRARIAWLLGDRSGPAPSPVLNTFDKQKRAGEKDEHGHEHGEGEEDHAHAGGLDGASTVPS
jgi:thiol-disulfide isomerase/thioredoxin